MKKKWILTMICLSILMAIGAGCRERAVREQSETTKTNLQNKEVITIWTTNQGKGEALAKLAQHDLTEYEIIVKTYDLYGLNGKYERAVSNNKIPDLILLEDGYYMETAIDAPIQARAFL